MTKDEIIKLAKEEHNVSLNPKDKLVDLKAHLHSLESSSPKEEVVKKKSNKDPVASRSEHGKVVEWSPMHREEYWEFIHDAKSLTAEEKKQLGL
jgi:hypothetical protein